MKPVPFLYPLQHKGWERLYAGSGVALYDAMSMTSGHGRGLPAHRHLTRAHALRIAPALEEGRAGRRVAVLRRTGGRRPLCGHVGAHGGGVRREGRQPCPRDRIPARGRACGRRQGAGRRGRRGVRGIPRQADRQRHRACGPTTPRPWWAREVSSTYGPPRASTWSCQKDRINAATGLILRTEKSVLFVIPWGRHWIIGTTDTDWNLDKAQPQPPAPTSTICWSV